MMAVFVRNAGRSVTNILAQRDGIVGVTLTYIKYSISKTGTQSFFKNQICIIKSSTIMEINKTDKLKAWFKNAISILFHEIEK